MCKYIILMTNKGLSSQNRIEGGVGAIFFDFSRVNIINLQSFVKDLS